jgi:transcriptional regulator of acetoin/glycerol metabolism
VCEPKLAGLLAVEMAAAPRAEQLNVLKRLTHVAALTLRAPRTQRLLSLSKADDYLRDSTEDEILRDKILLELHANEWNISRVARRLGVTRRTVYLRLDRLGIERVRIPKAEPRKSPA